MSQSGGGGEKDFDKLVREEVSLIACPLPEENNFNTNSTMLPNSLP
jgi:hypothetical protein